MRTPSMLVAVGLLAGLLGCDEKAPPPMPRQGGAKPPAASAEPAAAAAVATDAAEYPMKAPAGLEPMPVAESNPLTLPKARLGHKLFFDKRLSVDASRSCYSCHENGDGTGGHDPVAIGAGDKKLTRHAPTLWNVGYLPKLYWDGRADSLEAVVTGAWSGPNMGVGKEKLADKAKEIEGVAEYKSAFDEAYPGAGVTPDSIAQAIASYMRTLYCGNTAWDRFQAGQKDAMTEEQQQGFKLFTGKGMCNQCHTPPMFSDAFASKEGAFHNTGRGVEGKPEDKVDEGRGAITKAASEWAAFKTPSLRNITKSPPYFHDGSAPKIEDAVSFMAGGGFANKNRDSKLADRKLTDAEKKQLIAFLGSLECPGKLGGPRLP